MHINQQGHCFEGNDSKKIEIYLLLRLTLGYVYKAMIFASLFGGAKDMHDLSGLIGFMNFHIVQWKRKSIF